jgi:hypothetical protein
MKEDWFILVENRADGIISGLKGGGKKKTIKTFQKQET